MITLPQEFLERMRLQLGEEYGSFLQSYEEQGYAGLRVNTQKISVNAFLEMTPFHLIPVPWTKNGFYYRKDEPVTRHPHYYAGLYYIQEPSAMLPASLLPVAPGDMVLDLCAAPGGKATELSSRLQGKGLLVANDMSASRAKALLRNLTAWGAANFCVTAETPQRLLESFGCVFDKILVDAPCSGEGMFRRDAGVIEAWKNCGPGQYAVHQKEILSCAVQMLKPGGYLVYSTCTFSEEEDEDVIEEILCDYPELELCDVPMQEGFVPGRTPCEKSVRIWPHRVKGEGHFVALLHKQDDNRNDAPAISHSILKNLQNREIPGPVYDFLALLPKRFRDDYFYEQVKEQCLLLPQCIFPKRLRYLRTGILAGTLKHGRFEPSQPLAMLLNADTYPNVLNLSARDARTVRYLKGETIDLVQEDSAVGNGWVLVCVDGFALGWGKCAEDRIKNKYCAGWRMQ